MVDQFPSRSELIRRRRGSGFVGRQGEVAAFRDNLVRGFRDEAYQFLLFLTASPSGYEIQETLTDLADLRETLPVDADKVSAVQRQLEQARDLADSDSGPGG